MRSLLIFVLIGLAAAQESASAIPQSLDQVLTCLQAATNTRPCIFNVTEYLGDGRTTTQVDTHGINAPINSAVPHPSAITFESVQNFFKIGNVGPKPDPVTGLYTNNDGQHMGQCQTLGTIFNGQGYTSDLNGQWPCPLILRFYTSHGKGCINPDGNCLTDQLGEVAFEIVHATIFASFQLGTFVEFETSVLGANRKASGLTGFSIGFQGSDYTTFTYELHLYRVFTRHT